MEKLLFCLFGLLAISQGHIISRNIGSRIVNGTKVKTGEIPYQVSLQRDGLHICGGSILTKKYVVTAAHCVVDSDPSWLTIVAGTVFYDEPYQKRQSTEFIIHESYDALGSYRNDIALIKVDFPFEYSKLVLPVPLPDFHAKTPAKIEAIVSGWGSLGENNIGTPKQLRQAQIWIADQDYCATMAKKKNYTVYPTNICANDPITGSGQCNGDSGGPLTVGGKLIGIASWSIKDPDCSSKIYPGVYTRVPEYIDWLHARIFN